MNIAVPIACIEVGTTGEFVSRAFRKLGHSATVLTPPEFAAAFVNKSYDLFFCVDSGGPIDLLSLDNVRTGDWRDLAFWMIDYRLGKTRKIPNDSDTCRTIQRNGGWVFQSQQEDLVDCQVSGVNRSSWLPLAADPDVWNCEPAETVVYDVGFVGHCWDQTRAQALDNIGKSGLRLGFAGPGAAKMEAAAKLLRQCRTGFNISSLYGTPYAFDLNMRFWEELACGLPVITNDLPVLRTLFGNELPAFVKTYPTFDKIIPVIRAALSDANFVSAGKAARQFIVDKHTYVHRMQEALAVIKEEN